MGYSKAKALFEVVLEIIWGEENPSTELRFSLCRESKYRSRADELEQCREPDWIIQTPKAAFFFFSQQWLVLFCFVLFLLGLSGQLPQLSILLWFYSHSTLSVLFLSRSNKD